MNVKGEIKMDMKETLNFVQLQEQMINMMIRLSTLEKVLKDSGVLSAEVYTKELKDTTDIVSDKLKSVYNEIDKLKEAVSSSNTEDDQENKSTNE